MLPYIDTPVLLPADKFQDVKLPNPGGNDHYLQFVEAVAETAKPRPRSIIPARSRNRSC